MDEPALRQALVEACRALAPLGLTQGTSGNIGVRHGDAMLISPSATPYETMRPSDIAHVTLRDGIASGPLRPSSEWRFHRDILSARPELGAVVHAHAPFATTLAILRRPIPACHYMIAAFGGDDVRCAGYATFGTQALSDLAVAALQDRLACLLANHGMIACGRDLRHALWVAVELETIARQYYQALVAGEPVVLDDQQVQEARAAFADYNPGESAAATRLAELLEKTQDT